MLKIPLKTTSIFAVLLLMFFFWSCEKHENLPKKLIPLKNIQNPEFHKTVDQSIKNNHPNSGLFVLNRGQDSLVARAYLTEQATDTIDIQYFIWSVDNIGILASESLLRAAERGVHIRILVDDFLMDADVDSLLALSMHPNIEIKIYNPKYNVGTSRWKKFFNLSTKFVEANQRMHNKTFIVDGKLGITGGRNIADEYFDLDHEYNFRDRDALLIGPVVDDMRVSFETFWQSSESVLTENLLPDNTNTMTPQKIKESYKSFHEYAQDIDNYDEQHRTLLANLPAQFEEILKDTDWDKITFISDLPGKNADRSLRGGGNTTKILTDTLLQAKKSVMIQSPYFVVSQTGYELFKKLIEKNIEVIIVTNSLASTDNLYAYSGYSKKKKSLIDLGLQIYEYKDHPEIFKTIFTNEKLRKKLPTFAIHAKTLVVDGETTYIGTFNLDPRSANLNTECGVIVKNKKIAGIIEDQIRTDILPGNSWKADAINISDQVSFIKKFKLRFFEMLYLEPIL